MTKLHLIQQYYICNDLRHSIEIDLAVDINMKNKGINLHLLVQGQEARDKLLSKFNIQTPDERFSDDRLTFYNALIYAKDNTELNDYIVISNLDIVLDERIVPDIIKDDRLPQALSRWETDEKNPLDFTKAYNSNGLQTCWSQDTWIFKNDDMFHSFIEAFKEKGDVSLALGSYGCDNLFACYIFSHWGRVFNDFLYYPTFHLHRMDGYREWKAGEEWHPYGYVPLIYGEGLFIFKTAEPQCGSWVVRTKDFNPFILSCLRIIKSFEEANQITLGIADVIEGAKHLPTVPETLDLEPLKQNWFMRGS